MQQLGTMTMDPLLIEKIKNDFYIDIFYFIFIFKNFSFFFFFFFLFFLPYLKYQIKLSIKNNGCVHMRVWIWIGSIQIQSRLITDWPNPKINPILFAIFMFFIDHCFHYENHQTFFLFAIDTLYETS